MCDEELDDLDGFSKQPVVPVTIGTATSYQVSVDAGDQCNCANCA
jgi:hypothetical protein